MFTRLLAAYHRARNHRLIRHLLPPSRLNIVHPDPFTCFDCGCPLASAWTTMQPVGPDHPGRYRCHVCHDARGN